MKTTNTAKYKTQIAQYVVLNEPYCKLLLEKLPDYQRNIKTSNFSKLANDLEHGDWRDNGSSIVVSNAGNLIDGQHRLRAFLKTGVYPVVLLVTGVPEEGSYGTIDTGAGRTLADMFKAEGIPSASKRAAAARALLQIENGHAIGSGGGAGYSNTELLHYYKKHEEAIVFWSTKFNSLNTLVSNSMRSGVSCYAEMYMGREAVMKFWTEFESCIGNSNAVRLSKYLSRSHRTKGHAMHSRELSKLLVRVMIKHHAGVTIKKFHIPENMTRFKCAKYNK